MQKDVFIRAAALATLLSLVFCFFGCERRIETKNRIYYDYFDTVSTISDYSGGSESDFSRIAARFKDRLGYYHRLFDIYNEYDGMNNIASINRMAGVEAVSVDVELIDFLEYAKEMYVLTEGKVNIAMGGLLSIWHNYREDGVALPTYEELSVAAEHTDIDSLIIDREAGTVFISDAEISLDVGAIAKGYAAERIVDELVLLGAESYVIDLGGNLRAIGHKPGGESWSAAVQNPRPTADKSYVYYLDIADEAMVTSGDYQRYYELDGKRYHHIIDPDTLMPAAYFASVSVIAESSALADALSTALFIMDYDTGVALLDRIGGVSCVWVDLSGEIKTYGF